MLFKKMNKKGGFREYIISAVLVGLFVLALIGFGTNLAIDNNSNRSIINDPAISSAFASINSTLVDFRGSASSQLNATSSETPSLGFGSLVLYSIVGAGRVFTGTITGVYNVISTLLIRSLGVPAIVLNVFLAIMLVSIIFFAWRIYRIGS